GAQLWFLGGTICSWLGLNIGACLGFALARLWSRLGRSGENDDLSRQAVDQLRLRGAEFALWVTRPLPLLAETCVLALGMSGLPWRRFLPSVLVAHFVIAAAYSAAGEWSRTSDSLPQIVILSAFVPLGLALFLRTLWNRPPQNTSD
ncbi:MAG: VTT domain-containing protein, partial [Planctomycetaceae bacterium]|nr:VTT domain-containing protein [Planctomycetaceae bacterium]